MCRVDLIQTSIVDYVKHSAQEVSLHSELLPSGLFSTTTRRRTAASSARRWASSSGTCCTCWTAGTRSGGRPVRSARRTRPRRSASSPASTGQTNCESEHFTRSFSRICRLCEGEWPRLNRRALFLLFPCANCLNCPSSLQGGTERLVSWQHQREGELNSLPLFDFSHAD